MDDFGCLFMVVLAIVLTFVSCHNKDRRTYEQGYVQACKDIVEGRCKAELQKQPGGELRWVLKGVTEK